MQKDYLSALLFLFEVSYGEVEVSSGVGFVSHQKHQNLYNLGIVRNKKGGFLTLLSDPSGIKTQRVLSLNFNVLSYRLWLAVSQWYRKSQFSFSIFEPIKHTRNIATALMASSSVYSVNPSLRILLYCASACFRMGLLLLKSTKLSISA